MNITQTLNEEMDINLLPDPLRDFMRVPGLLRRWEIPQVVQAGADYRIEEAGALDDGTRVFAVFHRAHPQREKAEIGLPVELVFEPGQPPVRARMLPISASGDPLLAIVAVATGSVDARVLARVRDLLVDALVDTPSNGASEPAPSTSVTGKREGSP